MTEPQASPPEPGPPELLDVFDDRGGHLGVLARTEVHRRGLWHQVAHFLVVAHRPAGPAVILQRRARTKLTFPGLVDLSATGHLAAGELPLDGVRELTEELGVEVDPGDLVSVGVRRMVDQTPEGINRELTHVFLVRDDRPLESYRPDPAEVDGVLEVPIAALSSVIDPRSAVSSTPAIEITASGRRLSSTLTPADLVPEPLGDRTAQPFAYWSSVLDAGLALMQGREPRTW